MIGLMKFKKDWLKTEWGALTAAICIGVVLFLALSHLPEILHMIGSFFRFFRAIFMGIAMAYVLNPLVRLFEFRILKKLKKDRVRRILSVLFAVIIVVLLVVLLAIFLIPQLISSITTFVKNFDSYVASLEKLTDRLSAFGAAHGFDISRIVNAFQDKMAELQNALPSNMAQIVTVLRNIGSNIVDVIIAVILAIYFMTDRDRILRGCRLILKAMQKPATFKKTSDFFSRGHTILIRYILFDLLDGVLIGMANFIFMTIVGLPYAGLISFVVGITNLAPTFGPIIGGALGAFFLVMINPWYALYFLLFTVAIQIVDGYILKPRIFGGALGVPGFLVLICIVVGGKMFGAWGVILAIPFAAIAYYTIRETVLGKLEQRRAAEKAEATKA